MESLARLSPETLLPARQESQDPMAALALGLLSSPQDSLGRAHAQALLAFGQRVDFDPNALMERGVFGLSKTCSLLSFVLESMPYYTRGTRHAWPSTLEGFDRGLSERLTEDSLLSGEWVAAAFMAAGADPWRSGVWRDPKSGQEVEWGYPGPSAPVFHALRCGMAGLVESMLERPGAPDLNDLIHAPVPEQLPRFQGVATESWLHAACADEKLTPLLEWMLDKGVRPRPSSASNVLEKASPQAVELFSQRGLLPTQKDVIKKLESAWRSRAKVGGLSSDQQAKMSALLQGKELAEENLLAAEFSVLLTGNPWGKRQILSNYALNEPAESLTARARVPSGRLSGQWSRLAAHLVNRLRQSDEQGGGVSRFELSRMLDKSGQPNPSDPSPLSSAIGFEWSKGQAIDGVVALLLLGREPSGRKGEKESLMGLEIDAALLGVDDPLAWANSHVDASLAFTRAIVTRGAETAATTLASVWIRALQVNPDYLGSSMARRLELISTLHGSFTLSEPGRINRLVGALTPWTASAKFADSSPPPDFSDLNQDDLSLALEVALASRSGPWLERVVGHMGLFSDRDLDRIQQWVKVVKKSGLPPSSKTLAHQAGLIESSLNARLFDDSLPQAKKPMPGSRARF